MGWNCGVYVVSGEGWDMWMSVCGPLAGSRIGTRIDSKRIKAVKPSKNGNAAAS